MIQRNNIEKIKGSKMKICKYCGTLIDETDEFCPACNKKMVRKLIKKQKRDDLPDKYELATKEADMGMKWADFLSYGVFIFGSVMRLFIFPGMYYDLDSIWFYEFVHFVVSIWAGVQIIKRAKITARAVLLVYSMTILFNVIEVLSRISEYDISYVFSNDKIFIVYKVVSTLIAIILIKINGNYFSKRHEIFVY